MDEAILIWMQDVLRNDYLTYFFKFVTTLGNGMGIYPLFCILFLCKQDTRHLGIVSAVSMASYGAIFTWGVKGICQRVRPYEVITSLEPLVKLPKDSSFPSGHTGTAFAFASVLYFMLDNKIYGIIAYIFAVLMGISRMYVGVHYPSDVVAGAMFGTILGYIVVKIMH